MTDAARDPFRVCFVCTGNICRSPMAEVVMRSLIVRSGYERVLDVESAATGDWHVGERADSRTLTALVARGYDGSAHRARQFDPSWFARLDLVVVFDRGQERVLREWAATETDRSKVHLLMSFDPLRGSDLDVPDPYYSDATVFDGVLTRIERAGTALFRQIELGIGPSGSSQGVP